jgi:DNA-directed RNA polymerase subunit D
MKKVYKDSSKEVLILPVCVSLANALRRTVNEIKTLAVTEVEIHRNDSCLSDEILAHRIGLVPLKNEKVKEGETIEMNLKVESKEGTLEVLSSLLGKEICIEDIVLVRLEKGQGIELVARATQGNGKEHARHIPGLVYYYILNKIQIKPEGRKQSELAERFPKIFEFDKELKVKNEWVCNIDSEDLDVKGIEITPTDEVVFVLESWGMMSCSEMFLETVKVLNRNLEDLKKELK